MAFLAAEDGRTAVARDIAAATEVPVNYLQKILSSLARAGLLKAQRGLGGGFCLSRPAAAITMHEIFKAVDANVERITRCPLGRPDHTSLCPVHQRLDETYAMIDQVFRSTSLATLLATTDSAGVHCQNGGGLCPSRTAALAERAASSETPRPSAE